MMAEDNRPRHGLGRGLAALIGENTLDKPAINDGALAQRKAPIEFLRPNPRNPRRNFDDGQLDDLAASIKEKGVIQPILVRHLPDAVNVYEIIAGERRWRAAQRAGVHEVPIVVADVSDRESLEIAIVENVQRSDLNPLDEARAYEQLAADFGYTQEDLSRIIGKSRSHIANMLRLLKLPEYSRSLLASGGLSAGHGRALLALPDPDTVARRAIAERLSVRDLERLAQISVEKKPEPTSRKDSSEKDPDTRSLEQTLSDALGLIVQIKHKGEKGELSIKYKSLEQLDALCLRLRS